jgi:hypothetical protein
MKVYVGATFSRYPEARAVMDALTAAGHTVTLDWTRTDAFGPDGHPLPGTDGGYKLDPLDGARHAASDIAAIADADLLLMLAQEASCGWPVEVGIGIALDKPVWLVAPFRYTVFWDLLTVTVYDSLDVPLRLLDAAAGAPTERAADPSELRAARADRLRREHLAAHDVAHPIEWAALQESEQARWLLEADRDAGQEAPA